MTSIEEIEELIGSVYGTNGPVPLGDLLDRLTVVIRRHVVLSTDQTVVVALWIAHCWAVEATSTTAYLHIWSAEPESGKTRLIEVLDRLVPDPLSTTNITTAALFRAIHTLHPVVFIDEADNLLADRKAKSELFGILNAGYRRGGAVHRIGGAQHDRLDIFDVFCPKAIAGLLDLPATTASRSLRIELKRRLPGEVVEDFYREEAEAVASPLRRALAEWASTDTLDRLRLARPERVGLRDRLEESVRLMLAIADEAGEEWARNAREAIRAISAPSNTGAETSRVLLLRDFRDAVFVVDDEVPTARALETLLTIETRPWADWWTDPRSGEPTHGSAMKLARMLKPLGIAPTKVGPPENRLQGYRRYDFADAFLRYLPAEPGQAGQTEETSQPRGPRSRTETASVSDLDNPANPSVEPNVRPVQPRAAPDGFASTFDPHAVPVAEPAPELATEECIRCGSAFVPETDGASILRCLICTGR